MMTKRIHHPWAYIVFCFSLLIPFNAISSVSAGETLDLTQHWVGYTAISIFVLAYILVMSEEFIHLRKS